MALAIWDGAALAIAGAEPITAKSIERNWDALSHFPDRRARLELEGLGARINAFAAFLAEVAPRAEAALDLEAEGLRFAQMHVSLTRAYWASEARCMSWFITGPANFPTARNEKRMNAADARRHLVQHHAEKARRSVLRRAFPHGAPPPWGSGAISSDRPDAIALVKRKLEQRERQHARMKAVNAANAAFARNPAAKRTHDLMVALAPADEAMVRAYIPEYSWERNPFPSYSLANNSAEMRRLKQRIADLEARAGRESREIETNAGFRIVENAEANRIQLVFPGKPPAETRDLLKSYGFRWAPSEGAWQRMLNQAGRSAAATIRGKLEAQP